MTRSLIMINGVDGSDDDLPINTLVNLSNDGNGGEVTYLWAIVDQPEGTADVLSATTIQSPTFTPKKEGTYLLKLVVNQSLSDERSSTAIVAIRQMRTYLRIPAASETTEDSLSTGWARAVSRQLQELNDTATDANLVAAQVPGVGYGQGMVVALTGTAVIKTGLPGEEVVMTAEHALATSVSLIKYKLGVIERTANGLSSVAGSMVLVRLMGLSPLAVAGAPTAGDPVYLSDTGAPALVAGTHSKVIGKVLSVAGGFYYWFVDAGQVS